MKAFLKCQLFIATLIISLTSYGQDSIESDMLTITISLAKAVHFNSANGSDVLVPTGEYWVFPEENSLLLFDLDENRTYQLAAIAEKSVESFSEPAAVSLPGLEDEPDIHYIIFTLTGGDQLIAEGTYSGVRSRGWREKAQAARAVAAQRARKSSLAQAAKRKAIENARLMDAARAAQTIIEQAKLLSPDQAMNRAEYLLKDVAQTARDHGVEQGKDKAKIYAPELAVLSVRSLSPSQKIELSKQAASYINRNKDFIATVLFRIANSEAIQKHVKNRRGLEFSPEELRQITADIMGEGSNALQLPFVSPRGAADFTGPSIGIGASAGGSVGIGGAIGVMNALSLTSGTPFTGGIEFDPRICTWWSGAVTIGPKADLDGKVQVGFFQGAADDLGGRKVPVSLSFKATAGGGATVIFGFRRSETITKWIPKIAGIVLHIGAGVGGGGSVGISVSDTLGCLTGDGVTQSPLQE